MQNKVDKVKLTWFAVDERVAFVVFDALAACLMAERLAESIQATAVRQQAWVLARSVNARTILGTVVIVSTSADALRVLANLSHHTFGISRTLRRCIGTEDVRVALETGRARAQGRVVRWLTNCVAATHTKQTARILADAIDARLVERTATAIATSNHTFRAFANQPMTALRVFGASLRFL